MTIVIALACQDGVVMASDSQATEMTAGVRYEVQKVFQLTDQAVWGGSGDGQTISDMDRALQSARPQIEASADLPQDLVAVFRPVLIRRYSNVIQVPGQGAPNPATSALACGYDPERGAWITEVDPSCVSCNYADRGFHAIGSAAGFALLGKALLAHFRPAERAVAYGQLVAYRVISAAIETAHFGVGGKIQMWYVDKAGVHQVQDDELGEIKRFVQAWQTAEETALDSVFAELSANAGVEPTPLPEDASPPDAMPGS